MKLTIVVILLGFSISISATAGDYERCSRQNGYFDPLLSTPDLRKIDGVCLPATGHGHPGSFAHLDRLCNYLQLPSECVLASMLRAAPKGNGDYRYARCTADRKGLDRKAFQRPCLNEKYHFAAYSGFMNSMHCLGLAPVELFPLINHESRFQLNIESGTGALGVGQLTGIAIDEVNTRRTLEPLATLDQCARVKSALERPLASENSCQRLLPPLNPARSFLYAGVTYQYGKARATDLVNRLLLFERLPERWKKIVAIDLARWMYNGGLEGITTVLMAFAKEHPEGLSDYSQFRQGFQNYLAQNYGRSLDSYNPTPPKRRTEVAQYLNGIGNDLYAIEDSRPGLKCVDY